MSRIVILGAGPVGRYIAIDLCKDPGFEVVSIDISQEVLAKLTKEHPVQTQVEDLSTAQAVTRAVADADIVIGAVPGPLGYAMLETVIRAGKNIVDISYFLEDPFELDELAKQKEVTAVVDCGVENGKPATYTYDMYDEYDPATRTPSMARTTGYTCAAITRLVLDGGYSQTGIIAPEILGRAQGSWESVQKYLEERGVHCKMQRS